jgi:hypothetical protein
MSILLVVGCAQDTGAGPDARPVKIIARALADDKVGDMARQAVIRSDEELRKATRFKDAGELAKMLNVESVDFGKEMLVVASKGKTNVHVASSYKITGIGQSRDGKMITVHVLDFGGAGANLFVDRPEGELVLVERLPGEVRFEVKQETSYAP